MKRLLLLILVPGTLLAQSFLQIRRGNAVDRPTLRVGEPVLDRDSLMFWVGTDSGNVAIGGAYMAYGSHQYAVDTGASDAYVVTLRNFPVRAYFSGMTVKFKANTPNAGAATLDINSLGVKSITKNGAIALSTGDIPDTSIVTVVYDGSRFQLQGTASGSNTLFPIPTTESELSTSDKFGLDTVYYQAITTDGTYMYLAGHGSGTTPNLYVTKVNRITGETVFSDTTTSSALLVPFNDWNISDWYYRNGYIYAVFGKTTATRATKVVQIDTANFSLNSTVYTSNSGDGNAAYYGEGITFYDNKWWITYEGYSSGNVDYLDTFNSSWVKDTRYTFTGINTTNFPNLGVNHVQGIDFHDGYLWYTIHPQGVGFSYRGHLVAAEVSGTDINIVQKYDLTQSNLDDFIGEGMQWYQGKLYLNGIDQNFGAVSYASDANVAIVGGSIIGTSLNDGLAEVSGAGPHIFFPTFGSHYLEVADDAALDLGTGNFTLIVTIEPNGTQVNQAGLISKTDTSNTRSYSLSLTSANKPLLILNDGTDIYQARCEKVLESGKKYIIAVVVNRNLVEPMWYINGEHFPSDFTANNLADIGTLDNTGTFWFGRFGSSYYTGNFYSVLLFNRTLTRGEVRKYGWGDTGGVIGQVSTTARLANTNFSSADWTKTASVTSSGSMTFTTNAAGGVYPFSGGTLVVGKRYRLTTTYTHTASAIEIRQGPTSSTVLFSSATGGTVDFMATETQGPYIRLSGAGVFTATVLSVIELVDVISFLPVNLTHKQWVDLSYNSLVAEFRGSEIRELPKNYRQTGSFTYRKEFITLATTLTNALPPSAYITSIIIYNRTANAVTGGIKIGTSSGGTQVVTAQAVGASVFVECATINLRLFSINDFQTLYVDAVTGWNSASVDIFIQYVVLR